MATGVVRLKSSLVLFMIAAWLWWYVGHAVIKAQHDVEWSDPVLLSSPEVDAWAPTIAVDRAGNVHVVWSQTMTPDPPTGEGDTLFYARWDGNSWTQPVDVLVSPMGAAEWPDLAVTPDGMLHLVWGTGGQGSQLLYSQAPACCAVSPHNWSEPVSLYQPILSTPTIVADELGRLHVAYASSETGNILYQSSEDGGITWSAEAQIFSEIRTLGEYAIWPRLAVDARGRVHLVWTVLPWPGRAVLYARSDDGGRSWNQPELIDSADRGTYASDGYGPIYIDVEAKGIDEVHLIWDGAPTVERNHVWSSDGGETWSTRSLLFPEVSTTGRSGWNDMGFASDSTLHAVSLLSSGPPLHAMWDGVRWSASDRIVTQGPAASGELLQLAISRGSTLHVVWTKKTEQPFTVWYARGFTSAPELAAQALLTLETGSISTPLAMSPETSLLATSPTAPPQQPVEPNVLKPALLASPVSPLLAGLLPALVLVAVVFLIAIRRRPH